jgi:hypothetical protein
LRDSARLAGRAAPPVDRKVKRNMPEPAATGLVASGEEPTMGDADRVSADTIRPIGSERRILGEPH